MIGLSGSRGLVARAVTNALRKGLTTNQQPCWRSFPAASIDGLRNYHAVDGDKIPYDRDRAQLLKEIGENDQRRNTMAYSLSMASLEGNSFPPLTQPLSETQREQIRISALQHHHMRSPWYSEECESRRQNKIGDFATQVGCASKLKQTSSLPQTLQDTLRPTSRAIVVTETSKPFRVFNVNKAWEGLCGYSYLESKGRSLGSLLKGEETDQLAVTVMINKLLQGEEATAILTNYTKDGRRFRNRIHVGPLFDGGVESQQPSYFVGVLREV